MCHVVCPCGVSLTPKGWTDLGLPGCSACGPARQFGPRRQGFLSERTMQGIAAGVLPRSTICARDEPREEWRWRRERGRGRSAEPTHHDSSHPATAAQTQGHNGDSVTIDGPGVAGHSPPLNAPPIQYTTNHTNNTRRLEYGRELRFCDSS